MDSDISRYLAFVSCTLFEKKRWSNISAHAVPMFKFIGVDLGGSTMSIHRGWGNAEFRISAVHCIQSKYHWKKPCKAQTWNMEHISPLKVPLGSFDGIAWNAPLGSYAIHKAADCEIKKCAPDQQRGSPRRTLPQGWLCRPGRRISITMPFSCPSLSRL